jgi:putative ABC transport system permease protein
MRAASPALRLPPALRAARGGLTGRRVQTVVISLVVLAATAACTLALGMLVDSNAPFDHAFAAQHGAQVTATVAHQGAGSYGGAGARPSGVTAVAGPFAETTAAVTIVVSGRPGGGPQGVFMTELTMAGRASPGGPVDDLTITAGRWPRSPGEIVLERDRRGPR